MVKHYVKKRIKNRVSARKSTVKSIKKGSMKGQRLKYDLTCGKSAGHRVPASMRTKQNYHPVARSR